MSNADSAKVGGANGAVGPVFLMRLPLFLIDCLYMGKKLHKLDVTEY